MSQEKHFTHKYTSHITEINVKTFSPEENKIGNQTTGQQERKNNFGQKTMGDFRSTAN